MYTLSEDQLWKTSEFEEMRRPKSSQTKRSAAALLKAEDIEQDTKTAHTTAIRVKQQGGNSASDSRPDFYHGVGPFNDVNLPGVWFFRIPHKVKLK